ncbi:MAG: hypothetical protein QW273_01405 [Candidatus Pacearchaeota archaeon]
MGKKRDYLFMFFFFLVMFSLRFISAPGGIPSWLDDPGDSGYGPFYFNESDFFYFNITSFVNFSVEDTPLYFFIEGNIYSYLYGERDPSFYSSWISLLPYTGILNFYPNLDNRTQNFSFPINVKKEGSGSSAGARTFKFIIYAKNDPPYFLDLQDIFNPYNTSSLYNKTNSYSITFNGFDEEEHYPLSIESFEISSCNKPSWTADPLNCNLNKSLYTFPNTLFIINFTNITKDDVGTYNMSICIKDNINATDNYPPYRVSDYNENKTNCQNFSLNIFYYLSIDSSNCSNLIMTEGENLICTLNITTKYPQQNFFLWSNSSLNADWLEEYLSNLTKRDWFYPLQQNTSQNFYLEVPINISLGKRNVGNWTIRLYANTSEGESFSTNFSLFVNKTSSSPELYIKFFRENNKTSKGTLSYFNLSMYDEDFLIPDKNLYNETINLSIRIFNASSGEEVFWENFTNRTFFYQTNTSFSNQTLYFLPNSSQVGNWILNFSYMDNEGNQGHKIFYLEVLSKEPPIWNGIKIIKKNCTVNSTLETTSFCFSSLNLTDPLNELGVYASDPDGDSLSFSCVGDCPPSLNLSSDGNLNFKPWKPDVSIYKKDTNFVWSFNISAYDGYLYNSSLKFELNITNINSPPNISSLLYPSSVDENTFVEVQFTIFDDDLLIPFSRSIFHEGNFSLRLNVTNLSGQSLNISNFSDWKSYILSGEFPEDSNSFNVSFNFTPLKKNAGVHLFNLSVSDNKGGFFYTLFQIEVNETNSAPIFLENLTNKSSAVNRVFYYDVNVFDYEDGYDYEGNLTFNYSLLQKIYFGRPTKTDRIFDCDSCFNFSTGEFNLLLNESHAGVYVINVSVTDRGYKEKPNITVHQIFWLFVYDLPNISYPNNEEIFLISENETKNFNLIVNHTIGNLLTYEIYIDKISCSFNNSDDCSYGNLTFRDSKILSGNGDLVEFPYYFDFNEETYGNLKNLTFVVYPYDPNLENKSLLNSSIKLKINVTHTNAPVNISLINNLVGYKGSNPIVLNLSNYVFDQDNLDSFYKENLTFFISSNSLPSEIYAQNNVNGSYLLPQYINDSIIRFYSYKPLSESLFIIANDSSGSSMRSNNFNVTFLDPPVENKETIKYISESGGSSKTDVKYVALLISVPQKVKSKLNDTLFVPFKIKNIGETRIDNINLFAFFREILPNETKLSISLSNYSLPSLSVGQEVELIAKLEIQAKKEGSFMATIIANSTNPKVSHEANFYIEIEKVPGVNIEEVLVFTEKLLVENPECAELRERLVNLKKLKEEGKTEEIIKLSNEIIEDCKKSISQKRNFSLFQKEAKELLLYFFIFFGAMILFFLIIAIYKKVKFNKLHNDEIE